ncbi:twin-arginine translocation signal domain-containing protein [Natrinema salifodinae]|uniref:Tat (Twin-arginine translocation) pathway signal sequence n=1 Tax=Natrinema salifodinae TaxID=1202768 RepID=A0A1I0QGY8_9EURY|nr:twin-arginine translocation signal domain-containing protein [Natrinema salifodinae]SEW26229.1 Tat (twin-arginine translocation) pathway signal sequence [Natrinema salifodinae]
MPTRRSLLRKVGVTGVGTAAGVALLPSPPDATDPSGTVEATEPPAEIADWLGEPITDEDDAPIGRYHYEPTSDGFRPTAPFNVVLLPEADGERGLERVMSVLDDEGWVRSPEEYTRFAWDRETEAYVRQQATAAQTYYGTSGRRHVRCWSFESVVSMQAHEDTGARPKHGIASYRRGRETVEAIFEAAGWRVSPGAINLANEKGPDHDGFATVITEGP